MNDYKSTLNLPKTKFSMRANLKIYEPIILKSWYEDDLYNIIRQEKKGKKVFFLHDGPPYANGKIHIGHALNKILKDMIIKSKGLSGFDAPYIPGWDCHGLPIEHKIEKLTKTLKIDVYEFRALCRKYANEQIYKQKKNFIQLGILGDWKNYYSTMNYKTEANIIRILGKLIKKKYIYRGEKPVYWCFDCCSALAQAEIEYNTTQTSSIYLIMNAVNKNSIFSIFNIKEKTKISLGLLIWTTTTWTIPANQGISLHPEYEYQLIQIKNQCLIFAKNLIHKVMKIIGIKTWHILGTIKGHLLSNTLFYNPFFNTPVPVIMSEHVLLNSGTGAVHIAPHYGPDDYLIGKKYNLKNIKVIDDEGNFLPGINEQLNGLKIFTASNIIFKILHEKKLIFHIEKIKHEYPHCWRHKTPVIFRATPQWFIDIENKNLRKKLLDAIQKVKWIPQWGKTHMESMILNSPDWCISRQRSWGVPITLFIHKKNKTLHPRTIEFIEFIANKVEKIGTKAWWDLKKEDVMELTEAKNYKKVLDVLDVWFDSGSTHIALLEEYKKIFSNNIDMYLEGADQYRGWFMSSLIIATALKNKAPYRQVLTHGFTVDGNGKKMSKSSNNITDPQDIIKKFGTDILRLWVATNNYVNDIVVSEQNFFRTVDIYRRIRNTVRFLLANLNEFNPDTDIIKPENMIAIDCWAISKTKITQEQIITAYDQYEFHEVVKHLMQFCSVEMSAFYLDIIKDRQYTFKKNSTERHSCQTALWYIIESLVRWIAPIISFTANEIWNFLPGHNRKKYVFTTEWFNHLFYLNEKKYMNNEFWNVLLQVRKEVNFVIEQARSQKIIKSSLEANLILYTDDDLAKKLKSLGHELRFIFLTSTADVIEYSMAKKTAFKSKKFHALKIFLKKSDEKKCSRCWHYSIKLKENLNQDICYRCVENMYGDGEKRRFV